MIKISKETYERMVELVEEYELQHSFSRGKNPMDTMSAGIREVEKFEEPPYHYTYRVEEIRSFNPNFDQNKECGCGHPYHRHFDGYEDWEPIGCKFCGCHTFIEKTTKQ